MRLPDKELRDVRQAALESVTRLSAILAKDLSNKEVFGQAAASQMVIDLIDEVLELRHYVCDLHEGRKKLP